jgi:FkbM family methyltransferase
MSKRLLRKVVLRLLARFNPGDVTIKHAYTGEPVRLHSFKHRGYWYKGKRREQEIMELFARLIQPGDTVYDVGANIGYLSLYFAHLAGSQGKVYAFEPAPQNLVYTRQNVGSHPRIHLVEKGLAKEAGELEFYVEDLTGQNCSFVADFGTLQQNIETAGVKTSTQRITVEVTSLDRFVEEVGTPPTVMKIDVEGFELEVLQGATDLLRSRPPVMMIEIWHDPEKARKVRELIHGFGYRVFDDHLEELQEVDGGWGHNATNVFCFHPDAHGALMGKLGLPEARARAEAAVSGRRG